MHTFAIIPARMGSKRLPGKNSKILGGKPLAKWTIDCALASKVFGTVFFSTDDPCLAEVARNSGCEIPGLRPKNLAQDNSDLVSVCLDIIENKDLNIQSDDMLVLLQPTSPFRKPETIKKAIQMMLREEANSVIGFRKVSIKPEWLHDIDPHGYAHSISAAANLKIQTASKDYYLPNGLIYTIRVGTLIHEKSFYTQKTLPLICSDPMEDIDIDEPSDWDFAEYCFNRMRAVSKQ